MGLKGVLCIIALTATIQTMLCSDTDLRLKRGRKASRLDLSFVVRIEKDQKTVCTGVLVGKTTVLTTHRCVKEGKLDEYSIVLRARNCKSRRCEESRSVVSIMEPNSENDDVILVKLSKGINKQKYKTMQRLSEEKDAKILTRCKIVSFSDQTLREADVTIRPADRCKGKDGYKSLCLNIIKAAACKEDEGSPILCNYGDRWHLAGLMALDKNCQKDSLKAVRVSYFKASILQSLYKDTRKEPLWNGLRLTWGRDPASFFKHVPRTRGEAEANGWVTFASGTGCDGKSKFKGIRYIKDNDMAAILLFDQSGYIAGMQLAFPEDFGPMPNDFPYPLLKNKLIILDNGVYFLTAYFVDPATICEGRTAQEFALQGTGTGLRIQNGLNPVSDYLVIPGTQEAADKTLWTKSPCFATMGTHYWYNLRKDMDCYEFYPMFLLYDNGFLNGFGWDMPFDLTSISARTERPTAPFLPLFMAVVPDCVYNITTLSTIHIYFTDNPAEIQC